MVLMHPFELPGPQFLGFYVTFAAAVIVVLLVMRRVTEGSGPAPQVDLADPYLAAYLQGGKDEALRVASVALVDRGLLAAQGRALQTLGSSSIQRTGNPLEGAVLKHFLRPAEAFSMFKSAQLTAATRDLEAALRADTRRLYHGLRASAASMAPGGPEAMLAAPAYLAWARSLAVNGPT